MADIATVLASVQQLVTDTAALKTNVGAGFAALQAQIAALQAAGGGATPDQVNQLADLAAQAEANVQGTAAEVPPAPTS